MNQGGMGKFAKVTHGGRIGGGEGWRSNHHAATQRLMWRGGVTKRRSREEGSSYLFSGPFLHERGPGCGDLPSDLPVRRSPQTQGGGKLSCPSSDSSMGRYCPIHTRRGCYPCLFPHPSPHIRPQPHHRRVNGSHSGRVLKAAYVLRNVDIRNFLPNRPAGQRRDTSGVDSRKGDSGKGEHEMSPG